MLTFNDYKKLAKDTTLKSYEKVGFNDIHRKDSELNIFPDIKDKLNLIENNGIILDIGCGCSKPVLDLIEFCELNNRKLILIDNKEMLNNIDDGNFEKIDCEFPNCKDFLKEYEGKIENIVSYSVLHAVYPFANIFNFIDKVILLLSSGGSFLIADIANITKKKRFLSSKNGIKFHKQWSGNDSEPEVEWNKLEEYEIDDSIVFSILSRYRAMGCETYLLPQKAGLSMNHTREDILIVKN